MTEPFEFEGVRVCPANLRCVRIDRPHEDEPRAQFIYLSHVEARAAMAFIEAECDKWAYTNDEHTEARKGRWTAEERQGDWILRHPDFPSSPCAINWVDRPSEEFFVRDAHAVGLEFLAWHAAQNQPAEPTGEGFVGTLDTNDEVFHVYRNTSFAEWPFTWVSTLTGTAQVGAWEDVFELGGEFRP